MLFSCTGSRPTSLISCFSYSAKNDCNYLLFICVIINYFALGRVSNSSPSSPFSMLRVQQKIEVGLEVLQYFTTHKWCFKNEKFLRIRDSMCPEDKKEFNMDFKVVEDLPYLRHCILGARQYLLKEPLENLPKARRTIKMLVHMLTLM